MLSRIVSLISAVALALTAQALIPGLTSAAIAAPAKHKNCTAKSHAHAKLAAAKAAKAAKQAQRSGGGAGAQLRRSPDVQILSFGP
jgi:hypothetical protein